MKLRNTNPMGTVFFPLLGRELKAGEVFEVPDDVGAALLDQTANFKAVTTTQEKS